MIETVSWERGNRPELQRLQLTPVGVTLCTCVISRAGRGAKPCGQFTSAGKCRLIWVCAGAGSPQQRLGFPNSLEKGPLFSEKLQP